jgi:hypothetical protein
MTTLPLQHKRGNITAIFCMFVFVLLGGISYSLYVGQMVSDRIAEQTGADAAALSAANHVAQGLNMIAANNLSIGAAIQVAGSVSNLALYLGTIRALMVSADELPTALGIPGPSPAQRIIYDRMAKISSPFLQTASGLTRLNSGIYDYWQFMTPVRAMEVARVNTPGSIALAVPRIAFENSDISDTRLYRFNGMRTTPPKETVCRSYKASEVTGAAGMTQITTWLTAPFASLTDGTASAFESVLKVLKTVESTLQALPITLSVQRGGSSCGIELVVGVNLGIPVPGFLRRLGWPDYWGTIGSSFSVPLAQHGEQAAHFGHEHSNAAYNFGFLVPEVAPNPDEITVFERSIEYAQVVTTPLRSARQVNPANCPAAWRRGRTCDGVGLPSLVDERPGTASVDHETNISSGGLHKSLGQHGDMKGTLGRLKFRMAQAKAVFQPRGNADRAELNKGRSRQHQSTLWPGWESTLTHATLLPGVLGKITGMTGLDQFGQR